MRLIIIFLAYHIEFMGNKGRSNNRGPFWPDPSDLLRFQRRSSAVGPGLYSRGQLAVVAIDMRAIDIWVHISQGWQVRALLLPLSYLPPLQRFLRCTTQQFRRIPGYPIRGGPWIMSALCQPPWRVFDWKTVGFHEKNRNWKGEGLQRKTSDLPPTLRRLYSREPNEWCTVE